MKKNKFKTFCLSIILFFNSFVQAEEKHEKDNTSEPKKYTLAIGAVFKNESKYLKEWIEYHQLIGVDHFYLYNNKSNDYFMKELRPYIKKDVVTLIHWPDALENYDDDNAFIWALGTQASAYENAKIRALKESKWLVFIDIDEFLVPPKTKSLKELLEHYEDCPGVILSTVFFDASKKESALPQRKLLIETIELTKAPQRNPVKEVSKTIFQPELCAGFTWPPYQCIFKENQTPVVLKKYELRINQYLNRNKGNLSFEKMKDRWHKDHLFLSEEDVSSLLEMGYEIEDQERVIFQFVPPMLERMGYPANG